MRHLLIFLSVCWLLFSCGGRQNEALTKKSSSGKTLEVLLVADKGQYYGATRDLIDSIFREVQPCLPQPEPRFDIVNIPVSSLRNAQMFRMHRNIVLCELKKGNPDKVYIERDKWASPQVVASIEASSEASLRDLLRKYQGAIIDAIYQAEHQRIINAFHNIRNVELMNRVMEKFGFALTFSEDFAWASEDDGFAWIRKETKDFSLGILVNVTPYRDEKQFTPEKIYNRLDTIMRRHVPGPADGSYMCTERRIDPITRKVDYPNSPYCIETHGLWRLQGDFMGGPYVHYALLSPDRRTLVDLVGFVYCPRFNKRDYLMQVEGICNSLKWEEKEP